MCLNGRKSRTGNNYRYIDWCYTESRTRINFNSDCDQDDGGEVTMKFH